MANGTFKQEEAPDVRSAKKGIKNGKRGQSRLALWSASGAVSRKWKGREKFQQKEKVMKQIARAKEA